MLKSFKQFFEEYDFTKKKVLSGIEHIHTFDIPSNKGTSKVRVEIVHQHNDGHHYHDVSFSVDHNIGVDTKNTLEPGIRTAVMHRVGKAIQSYVRDNVLTQPGEHTVFGVAADDNASAEGRKADTQASFFRRLGRMTGGEYSRRNIYNQLRYSIPA